MTREHKCNVHGNVYGTLMHWDADRHLKIVWLLQTAKDFAEWLDDDTMLHEFDLLTTYYFDRYLLQNTKKIKRPT